MKRMAERENWLRAVEFSKPDWIPISFRFTPSTWRLHRKHLKELISAYPMLFSLEYREGAEDWEEPQTLKDHWGCTWNGIQRGLGCYPKENPLSDWGALAAYQPPDPLADRDWENIAKDIAEKRKRGILVSGNGGLPFERLYCLRGFENLMMDFAADDPRLSQLIAMVTNYKMGVIGKYLEIGVDSIRFHSDLGTQKGLMISPAKFRRYIKPMFRKMFDACRNSGVLVHLSSDGCLLEIVDDLIECGISVHDPQLTANELNGLIRAYKGKMCAEICLSQELALWQTEEIQERIEEIVRRFDSPEGGLMFRAYATPDVPLENIKALCAALEKYRFYYTKQSIKN